MAWDYFTDEDDLISLIWLLSPVTDNLLPSISRLFGLLYDALFAIFFVNFCEIIFQEKDQQTVVLPSGFITMSL